MRLSYETSCENISVLHWEDINIIFVNLSLSTFYLSVSSYGVYLGYKGGILKLHLSAVFLWKLDLYTEVLRLKWLHQL